MFSKVYLISKVYFFSEVILIFTIHLKVYDGQDRMTMFLDGFLWWWKYKYMCSNTIQEGGFKFKKPKIK